jgi:predicted ATPase
VYTPITAVPLGYRESTVIEEEPELELLSVLVVDVIVVAESDVELELEAVAVVDVLPLVDPVVVEPVALTALWLVVLPVLVDVVLVVCEKNPAPLMSTKDAAPTIRSTITATTAIEIPLDRCVRHNILVI